MQQGDTTRELSWTACAYSYGVLRCYLDAGATEVALLAWALAHLVIPNIYTMSNVERRVHVPTKESRDSVRDDLPIFF